MSDEPDLPPRARKRGHLFDLAVLLVALVLLAGVAYLIARFNFPLPEGGPCTPAHQALGHC
jgi:hypothetical protein